jgi:chromosome segregation ATPase
MTNEKENILNEFKGKFKQIVALCDRLREENTDLRAKKESLEKELDNKADEITVLNSKYENLKTLNSLISGDNSHDTKIKLNRIVREIDRCLSLIDSNQTN